MSSTEPPDYEPVTVVDVGVIALVLAYLAASIWCAYRASVVWESFQ